VLSSISKFKTWTAPSWRRRPAPERADGQRAPRSRLLLLVYLASLSLLLSLGAGLAILASAYVSSSAIAASASADRELVRALVEDLGAIVSADPAGESAAGEAVLRRAIDDVGLVGVAIAAPDGTVRMAAGDFAWPSEPRIEFGSERPLAVVASHGERSRLVEAFPVTLDGALVAIIGIVRDGQQVLATAAAAQRDIALGTAAGASVLIIVLFLVFRGAQVRLDAQTEQLLESERRDPLTGLLTHGAATAALAEALVADDEQPTAIALLDIDNFKRLNDTHGHELGDRALLEVAAILERANGPGEVVGRSGPDEFIVVAHGLDGGQLAKRMEAARRELAEVVLPADAGDRLPLTVSVGIGVAPLHGRTATELLSAVAVSLGEAKTGGGDQLVVSQLSYAELAQERWSTFSILDGLVNAVDARDRYTRHHSEDVARYALFLAQEVGLDEEQQAALHSASLLHDVGKIAVPDAILRKPGHLTPEEMEVVKQHVAIGGMLVRDLANAEVVADGVRHHHERWDGSGYPDGLAGEEISLVARIIAVADAFSAMTTSRPYRHALTPGVALERLSTAAGTQLDPRLVDVFVLAMETQAEPPLPSDSRLPSFWLALVPA
jgi:diguanylate cyclase (GGDEF)-like protein/putative nucleotidyltransferase with HDIG domain